MELDKNKVEFFIEGIRGTKSVKTSVVMEIAEELLNLSAQLFIKDKEIDSLKERLSLSLKSHRHVEGELKSETDRARKAESDFSNLKLCSGYMESVGKAMCAPDHMKAEMLHFLYQGINERVLGSTDYGGIRSTSRELDKKMELIKVLIDEKNRIQDECNQMKHNWNRAERKLNEYRLLYGTQYNALAEKERLESVEKDSKISKIEQSIEFLKGERVSHRNRLNRLEAKVSAQKKTTDLLLQWSSRKSLWSWSKFLAKNGCKELLR